jgi:superfamily II DNA or RNA helicase
MKNIKETLLNINSWDQFFTHANSLTEKEKGDIFEQLTYLILVTRPEYASVLKNVWLQGQQMPQKVRDRINLPNTDLGIDLVAETIRGEFWAIQCKFKGQNQTPTYKEISTFSYLANTYCKSISLAVLVHTGEKGVKKKSLLGENYTEIGLDFWLNITQEDWTRIHKKLNKQSVRPEPRNPRPHQINAIKAAQQHYLQKNQSRGRLIMPCGTGKSLTAFWIANALKAKSVIVAVPSLYLIKQSLQDWTKEFTALNENPKPEWLVICSDDSTGNLEKDEFVSDTYSMGIPTTTNSDKIFSFLNDTNRGRKIIFTTYQSSEKLAKAAKKCKFKFDLAILDESHKTVGEKSKYFATLLSDKNIYVSKRMFMTATERVVRGRRDDVYSMDDESIYGKQIFQLTFKEAIHSTPSIICDYKILTITVSNQEIQDLVEKNMLISDKKKKLEEQEAQSIASAIALRIATKKYGINHAISFHRSIKSAEEFSNLNQRLNLTKIDEVNFPSFHISSKISAGQREQLMQEFSEKKTSLMTNARCLTEGIDVPAIDCVLFADPKQSVVDIVQAAGRALRPYKGKDFGYIMMPLIVPDNQSFEEFSETTPFKQIARIISALSTQDERIAEEFSITTRGKKINEKRIVFEGAAHVGLQVDFKEFIQKINTKIWEKVGRANLMSFEDARNYARSLKLKNQDEWQQFCLSGQRPPNLTTNPQRVYTSCGWNGFGDWLGTDTLSNKNRKYRTFDDAKKYVHALNLKSVQEWKVYCKTGNKPIDIPSNPNIAYFDMGWNGYGDWLGTNVLGKINRKYRNFSEARKYMHSLNLKNTDEWKDFYKSGRLPIDIPMNPRGVYKMEGWKSMGDWLGTGVIAKSRIKYLPYDEAKSFVRNLNLNSGEKWREYCKSGIKPDNIPAKPDQSYKGKGWKSMGDWLGTERIATQKRQYLPFNQALKYTRNLKLKSMDQWLEHAKKGLPSEIPVYPSKVYKNKGWQHWSHWLGTSELSKFKMNYLSFEEARSAVHRLKLKSQNEWKQFCLTGKRQINIPSNPNRTYKSKGWKGWSDWLGNK